MRNWRATNPQFVCKPSNRQLTRTCVPKPLHRGRFAYNDPMLVLRVNGQDHELAVAPETPLLYVLRNDLGLTGAKFGCGLEQCGSCTVIVGGEAVLACGIRVGDVAPREVVTVETLNGPDGLHPLAQAFLDEQAAQCAYCIPGILMEALALLAWNASPSPEEIRRQLATHLCRCGAHHRIVRAVERAAKELRS